MRGIERGKKTVYLSKRLPDTPVLDENGNDTGNLLISYDDCVTVRINVKDASEESDIQAYGIGVKGLKKATVTAYEMQGYQVMEDDIAWIGVTPNGNLVKDDPTKPMNQNYTVDKVQTSDVRTVIYFKKIEGQ